jgi:hypothetical protein
MRATYAIVLLSLASLSGVAHAQDLAAACHATSSYDLSIGATQLLFDRAAPEPRRIVFENGSLRIDGQPIALNDEDQDRVAVFERDARALEPRVKAIANEGVDIAVQTVREQAGTLNLSADTRAELDRRLATHVADLKLRIANSQSTHDWHGDEANAYANQIAEDIAPVIAADLGQQAVNAALNGDMQTAENLRERATDLASQLQPRLQRHMQVLRPQIQALCPDIRRLADLQEGLRDGRGRPLDLLRVGQ